MGITYEAPKLTRFGRIEELTRDHSVDHLKTLGLQDGIILDQDQNLDTTDDQVPLRNFS